MNTTAPTALQVAVYGHPNQTKRVLSLEAPVSFLNHSHMGMETLQLDEHHAAKAVGEYMKAQEELQRGAQKTGAAEIYILDPNDLAHGGAGSHAYYRALLARDLNGDDKRAVGLIPLSDKITEAGALASELAREALGDQIATFESYKELENWLTWQANGRQ